MKKPRFIVGLGSVFFAVYFFIISVVSPEMVSFFDAMISATFIAFFILMGMIFIILND